MLEGAEVQEQTPMDQAAQAVVGLVLKLVLEQMELLILEEVVGHQLLLLQLQEDLAVVELPVPLNTNCNPFIQHTDIHAEHACEYARIGLAVWKADPGKFPAFDAFMFEDENPPTVAAARKKGEELVGVEAFKSALENEDVGGRMDVGLKIFNALKGGAIPKLLLPQRVAVGETDTAEQLYELLEREAGVAALGK